MRLSYSWLKRYLDISYKPEKIAEMLTTIGLEVEGIERVESIKGGLRGIVIGEVVSLSKHPDADRLSVAMVRLAPGEDPVQIVCGAPNIAAGQKVVVATIGTELFQADGTPWTIKKGKIRGAESNGMICAADEIGMGDDHSGIMVLPETAPLGLEASKYFRLEDDFVFEVGLTPNRSDATSQLGVARDLLAYLRVNEQFSGVIREPDITGFVTAEVPLNIKVSVESPEACIRYAGITICDVQVGESPDWLKRLLTSVGVKPINNIVDVTNFILHELGQPLHAFDADKITGQKIIVKKLEGGTSFTTLDGVSRKLHGEDLMICDGEGHGLCMAGVYGGQHSGVSSGTRNVFLESACFSSGSVRRTSMRHNLRTDAAKVFEKGADPNVALLAMKRAAALIKELAGGQISKEWQDVYPVIVQPARVDINYNRIWSLIGMDIPREDIKNILLAMNMEVTQESAEGLTVLVPTNKADVTREVDIIEEIIRIYGLNRVPVSAQVKSTISYSERPDRYTVREQIAGMLAARGFNEMMGLSLMESRIYEGLEWMDASGFVYVNNTSNIHLDIMRPDMLGSGLISVAHNLHRQQGNLMLFEFGKSYQATADGYREDEAFTLFMAGKKHEESWLSDNKAEKTYYDLKKAVISVLHRTGIQGYKMEDTGRQPRFSYGMRVVKGNHALAEFGEVSPAICQKMGIKTSVFYAEISFDALIRLVGREPVRVQEISRFPSVRRDLALVVNKEFSFEGIEQLARQTEKKKLKQVGLFDVYENEQHLGKDKKSYAVSFVFEDMEKTMNDQEIDHIMARMIQAFEAGVGAQIRK